MTRRLPYVLLLSLLALLPVAAGAQASTAGFGVRYAIPYETFAETHDRGWGINWTSLAVSGATWMSLGGGWTRFEPLDSLVVEGEDGPGRLDQGEVTLGFGIRSGQLMLGARAGYFFRNEHEWDLMPIASMRFGPLLLSAEAKVLGDVRWYGGSASWFAR